MIDVKHLIENPDSYRRDMKNRQANAAIVDEIIALHAEWRTDQREFELCQEQRNKRNKEIPSLSPEEKKEAFAELKSIGEKAKQLKNTASEKRTNIDQLLTKVPILAAEMVPVGATEDDNQELFVRGTEKQYDFEPKPYYELDCLSGLICQEEGVQSFGARGYYLRGKVALLQKALMDYSFEKVNQRGFEMIYVPLMLNESTLTATGHLPDFEGQQYEVDLGGEKKAYLIGSSEPSLMSYFRGNNLSDELLPIKVTALTSCFRKEAGSYGKDQRGIIRNHQFEKLEMVIICMPDKSNDMIELLGEIECELYDGLGIRYRGVEICTADLPKKHCRQIDYEAYFPGQKKFLEIASNGNAGDYQTRSLIIRIKSGKKTVVAHSLNCTAMTFRTGLAILEQNQRADGTIEMPDVLKARLGFDSI